jgi:hypothetical protein
MGRMIIAVVVVILGYGRNIQSGSKLSRRVTKAGEFNGI